MPRGTKLGTKSWLKLPGGAKTAQGGLKFFARYARKFFGLRAYFALRAIFVPIFRIFVPKFR